MECGSLLGLRHSYLVFVFLGSVPFLVFLAHLFIVPLFPYLLSPVSASYSSFFVAFPVSLPASPPLPSPPPCHPSPHPSLPPSLRLSVIQLLLLCIFSTVAILYCFFTPSPADFLISSSFSTLYQSHPCHSSYSPPFYSHLCLLTRPPLLPPSASFTYLYHSRSSAPLPPLMTHCIMFSLPFTLSISAPFETPLLPVGTRVVRYYGLRAKQIFTLGGICS